MDNPEDLKETVTPVEIPQEPVIAQAEEILGKEKPNILKRFWPLFLIFGAIIILSLAVLVYGYQKLNQEKPSSLTEPTPTPIIEVDDQTSTLEEQGTSDETEEIEADLEATDLSEIDKELEEIDQELSSP